MKFEIYQGKKKQFNWRLRARNGKIIADGSESYTRKSSLLKILKKIIEDTSMKEIKDLTNGERILIP